MKILLISLQIFVFLSCVEAQIENGWKGIKVLETKREAVEKLLGKPKETGIRVKYETEDAYIEVMYSAEPCSSDGYLNKFKVDRNTVLEYEVNLKEIIEVTKFDWNKADYTKATDGEGLLNWIYYDNLKLGISVGAVIDDDNVEKVRRISFNRTTEQVQKFSCAKCAK